MRIALLHAWAGGPAAGGGGSRVMLDLGLALRELGHEITIVCHDYDPGTEHRDAGARLELRYVRTGPPRPISGRRDALRRTWIEMPRMAKLVPEADVIDAHEWPGLRAAAIASRRSGTPFVWHRNDHTIFERAAVQDPRHGVRHGRLARTARLAGSFTDYRDARRAAAVVALDPASRDLAERAYRRPVDLIPSPPADHFFDPPDRLDARRRIGVDADSFLILGVGIMYPHRRFEDLIDAVAQVDDRRLAGLIIGSDHIDPAYARFVRSRRDELGLADTIDLRLNSVPENELRDAYAAADLFVFPNDHRQSWGLAPLEALAAGTPVLVTTGAGVGEAIAGRPGVTTVEPRQPDQIASALRSHLAGENSRATDVGAWVRAELGLGRYAERNLELYERVLAR